MVGFYSYKAHNLLKQSVTSDSQIVAELSSNNREIFEVTKKVDSYLHDKICIIVGLPIDFHCKVYCKSH